MNPHELITINQVSVAEIQLLPNSKNTKFETKMNIRSEIDNYIKYYIALKRIFDVDCTFESPFQEPINSPEQILQAASKLKELWNINSPIFPDVFSKIQQSGIIIAESPTYMFTEKIGGYINNKYPLIILYKDDFTPKKRFYALHELAFFLFNFSSEQADGQREALADLFAEEMLMSDQTLISLLEKKHKNIYIPEFQLIEYQYGIPLKIVMKKALRLDLISQMQYDKIYDKLKSESFDCREDKSYLQEEVSCQFKQLVFKALGLELIYLKEAAQLLEVPLDELKREFLSKVVLEE